MGRPTSGGATSNVLKGTKGNDMLQAPSDAPWTIDGGAGNDIVLGGGGRDTLLGGAGDDIIFGLPTDAKLDGGTGFDTLDASLAPGVVRYVGSTGRLTDWYADGAHNSAAALNFERVIGGSYNDYLFGNDGGQTLLGGGGTDYIESGRGNDTLVGGYLSLDTYNPRGLAALPTDDAGDYFQFSGGSGGTDRVLDFQVGTDHLFFYGVEQPNLSAIYESGNDVVVPWANGTVTLLGIAAGIDPSQYGSLFATSNGDGLSI